MESSKKIVIIVVVMAILLIIIGLLFGAIKITKEVKEYKEWIAKNY